MQSAENSDILLKAFAGSIAIIVALVGILYHKLTDTDSDQQTQLDKGSDEFATATVRMVKVEKDLEAIAAKFDAKIIVVTSRVDEIFAELSEFEIKRLKDHESVLLLKHCHKEHHGEDIP